MLLFMLTLLGLCVLLGVVYLKKMVPVSGIMPDRDIRKECLSGKMIDPFAEGTRGISCGLSSYGYDASLYNQLFIFENKVADKDIMLDPKKFNEDSFITVEAEAAPDNFFILPPHGFALGRTNERFVIPEDVLVICVGKSTYARCGLIVNVTPLEPGWEGTVTLELSNTTPFPVKVYANEGICQFLFFKSYAKCDRSYKDKKGKYMDQKDIVLAKY